MTAPAAMHAKNSAAPAAVAADERAAAAILRGVQRLMRQCGCESVSELPLGNGRRADVVAIDPTGEIHIVEIKSSVADFRADLKWPEYRDFCDRFSFAVAPSFPVELLPTDAGLILADGYGGEIVRPPGIAPLAAARRKAMLLSFARTAAMRLLAHRDPTLPIENL